MRTSSGALEARIPVRSPRIVRFYKLGSTQFSGKLCVAHDAGRAPQLPLPLVVLQNVKVLEQNLIG